MKKTMKIAMGVMAAAVVLGGLRWYKMHQTASADVEETAEVEKFSPVGPTFNADSAYAFTATQCAFGPRDMNSKDHDRCEKWIVAQFECYGCTVETQKAVLKGYDGTPLRSTNIIAHIHPKAKTRLLFCAHWDSRPWADNDPDSTQWRKPILAANDAASGVAVMLELARTIQQDGKLNTNVGIDFVCFDAEDWGTPQWSSQPDNESTWALGAQYWASHYDAAVKPRFGVLLDMVGGMGAQFYRELKSLEYAPDVVKKVWRAARQVGFGSFFLKQDGGGIIDDHVPVNELAGIPTIDIIPFYPDCRQSSFGPTWHTMADNMANIDKQTLRAVGQTMVQVIYSEQP